MEHYRNNNILNYSIYLCNNELIKAKNGFGPVFTRQFTYHNYHKKNILQKVSASNAGQSGRRLGSARLAACYLPRDCLPYNGSGSDKRSPVIRQGDKKTVVKCSYDVKCD